MNFEIRIFKNLEILSREAANLFAEQAANAIDERGLFLVALNGGSTPNRLFQLLATDYREKVDWSHVHVFWGDERCVPPQDAGSSYGQARDAFLSHVPIPDSNINRVRGELEPAEASRGYAHTLSQFASPPLDFPRFDLVYLGMGEDGHTASLFPGSPVDVTEPTLPVTAHYQGRPANRAASQESPAPQVAVCTIRRKSLNLIDDYISLMFAEYIQAAMDKATYEIIDDPEPFCGEVPELQGLWATGKTLEECRMNLRMPLKTGSQCIWRGATQSRLSKVI